MLGDIIADSRATSPGIRIQDGPFLELGLKGIAGTLIDRPRRSEDRPDRDRLALRFEQQFKKAKTQTLSGVQLPSPRSDHHDAGVHNCLIYSRENGLNLNF